MTLTIPDELLIGTGLNERELLVELACRLFDIGRLPLWPAARLAGLDRVEFEEELRRRGIPAYRPTLADLQQDLEALDRLGV